MKPSIQVAMIIQDYYPHIGGAERQLGALAPLLQARGVDIHILTRHYPGLATFEMIDSVPVHRLFIRGSKAIASMMFTLASVYLLKQLKPHLIHAHGLFSPTTTAVIAKRILGVPVVAKSLRGGILGDLDRLKRKPFGKHRIASFQQSVDAFITISHEIRTELIESGIPPERCFFIPNGVDLDRFRPLPPTHKQTVRKTLGLSTDALVVVYIGRLEAEKCIDRLINVWPGVYNSHPQAVLLIVGTGVEEEKLKQIAGEGIRFAGRIEDVVPYLQVADLFVLPSATEGLSNSILEALASGVTVVATAVGGTPDVIKHQETGWLIPPNTPTALQEAITKLLDHADLRYKLSNQGHNYIAQNYALTLTADRLRALYDQLIA